jgi:TolB protein
VPWLKVGIGAAAVLAVLTAIGLLLPNMTGSIQVSSAGPGTGIVLVSGIGFIPGEAVDLSIDGIPAGFAIANSDGSINAQLTVGTQATGRVDALGRLSGNQASSDYAVIIAAESIAPTATPEPNESGGEIASAQPDSPGILFYSDVEPDTGVAGDKEIYLWDPLSGQIEQLTFNDVHDTFPAWSPDHTQIAFSRQLGATPEGDIFIRDLAGTYEAPLTSGPADDWYPAWSKNNEIAFARRTPPSNESAIVVIRPDVAGERVVVSGTEVRAPSWSPDGTTLAFMSRMFAPDLDVSIVRADGTGSIERLTSGTSDDRTPTWSPDGLTLAFTMNIGAREGDELYLLDVGTKIAQPLTDNDVQDGNPVWSPDGSQIAFFRKSSTGYHIWITDANGSERDLMPERLGNNIDPNWR